MSADISGLKCSACGYRFDRATMHNGHVHAEPDDGSISVCVMCTNIQVFTKVDGRLGLRPPNLAELAELAANDHVQAAIQTVRRWRGIR